MLFQNPDAKGFWDAILFLDRKEGFLLGDPVDGHFVVMRTLDGGESWTRDNSPELGAEPKGEGAFAASNSSLVVTPAGETILFGTGSAGGSRVFFGRLAKTRKWPQWNVSKAPLSSGKDSSGIFGLAFRDALNGITVGGDYKSPNQRSGTAALTHDGGRTWVPSKKFPRGFRSSVAWSSEIRSWIAAGPNGVDSSRDDGQTWDAAAGPDWNLLSWPWIAGPQGAIAKLRK